MSLQNKCTNCGCEDSYLTTPPPCPTAIGCPFEECAEIQYAQCIMYTGGDLLCGNDLVVPTDTNMEAAITNIKRDELKSELIAIEEELAKEDLVPVKEEEESNNNQIEQTNGDDFEWF